MTINQSKLCCLQNKPQQANVNNLIFVHRSSRSQAVSLHKINKWGNLMDEDMIWNHFYGKSSLNLKTVLSFQTLLSISPHRTSAFHSKIAIWIPAAEDHPFCKDTYHATEPIEVHYRCPYLIIKILKLARFLKRNLLLYAGFLKRNLLLNFVLKTLPWSHRLFITSITPLNMVQLGTVLAWSRGHIDEHQINRKISPLHKKMVNLDLNEAWTSQWSTAVELYRIS